MDLLVSLTYCAASDNGLKDFPVNMNLQVPAQEVSHGLVDFDPLPDAYVSEALVRASITLKDASVGALLDNIRSAIQLSGKEDRW